MNPLSPFSPQSSDSSLPKQNRPASKPLSVEVKPIFSVLGQVMAWLGLAIEVKVLEKPTDMKPKSLFFSKKHLVKALDDAGISHKPSLATKIYDEALQTLLIESTVDLNPQDAEGVRFTFPQHKVRLFQQDIQNPNALLFSGPRGTMVVLDRPSILKGFLKACPPIEQFRANRTDDAFADFLISRLVPEHARHMTKMAEVFEMLKEANTHQETWGKIEKLLSK